LKDCNTPHIVPCVGLTKEPNTKKDYIVLQSSKNGNLEDFLVSNSTKVNWSTRRKIARDIAKGLGTLHIYGIIHCNLKTKNIILTGEGWPPNSIAISDFGLSCLENESREHGTICGVLPFIAPEVLRGEKYTKAADIYSFGLILWRLTSNEPLYPNRFEDRSDEIYFILDVCSDNDPLRPSIIDGTPLAYVELMKRCWDSDPSKRPTISEIIHELINMDLDSPPYRSKVNEVVRENSDGGKKSSTASINIFF